MSRFNLRPHPILQAGRLLYTSICYRLGYISLGLDFVGGEAGIYISLGLTRFHRRGGWDIYYMHIHLVNAIFDVYSARCPLRQSYIYKFRSHSISKAGRLASVSVFMMI